MPEILSPWRRGHGTRYLKDSGRYNTKLFNQDGEIVAIVYAETPQETLALADKLIEAAKKGFNT